MTKPGAKKDQTEVRRAKLVRDLTAKKAEAIKAGYVLRAAGVGGLHFGYDLKTNKEG